MSKILNLTTEDWQTVLEIHGRIAQQIPANHREVLLRAAKEVGLAPGKLFHFVYVVENFDPADLSVANYQKRDPFDHPQVIQAHLNDWARVGWLEMMANGRFQITRAGHQIRQLRWQIIVDAIASHNKNQSSTLANCLATLKKVKQQVIDGGVTEEYLSFFVRYKKGLKPPPNIGSLLQLIEYRMDFGALRDDVHLAAWREVAPDLSPVEWELISIVGENPQIKLGQFIEQQARRGFEQAVFDTAVTKLTQIQWLKYDRNLLKLEAVANKSRVQVEKITNTKFFNPWQEALTNHEIENHKENLKLLRRELGKQ
ncbi:MAG: hypothetical protein AAF490_21200 [Chloroflexota bacterium]